MQNLSANLKERFYCMKSQFIFISLIILSLNGWGLSPIQANLPSGAIELKNSIQDDFLSYSAERDSLKDQSLLNASSSSIDQFLALKAAYDKGTPVSFRQAYGVYAGECYQKYFFSNTIREDYYRYNSASRALVVKEFDLEANNDLFFPPAKEKKVLSGFYHSEEDSLFQQTAEQIVKDLLDLENDLKRRRDSRNEILSLSPLKVKLSYIPSGSYISSPWRFSDILSFVLYQNDIFMKISAGEKYIINWKHKDQPRERTVQKDEDVMYCRFFDKK